VGIAVALTCASLQIKRVQRNKAIAEAGTDGKLKAFSVLLESTGFNK
jgi:hypothetical protein